MRKRRLAILISGRGSNMEAIARETQPGGMLADCAEVAVVAANRAEAVGLRVAAEMGLPTVCVPSRGRGREEFERELLAELERFSPDWIVLAGFMRVLSPLFVARHRNRIVNIHPADAREYQGAHGYEWAWERGLAATWITVHYVDEGVDTGEIIALRRVDLAGAASLDEVRARGLRIEHGFFCQVLRPLCLGRGGL